MNGLSIEGYLIKISKGRWATINNRRYFALKVDGRFLVYYEKKPTEIKQIPKKLIPTESIISVERIKSKDNKSFIIKTRETTYTLKAYNKENREQWFRTLSKAVEKVKKDKQREHRNYSNSKSSKYQRSENDFLSRPRSQTFTTTDPKMNLSILMKIQTDTTSTYETTKTKSENSYVNIKSKKKNIFNSVVSNDLLINEQYKKIDIAEENFQIFECEISKIKYQHQELTKIFGIFNPPK